jgi:hypothetical protein
LCLKLGNRIVGIDVNRVADIDIGLECRTLHS